mgnify:CR=1 FL=1
MVRCDNCFGIAAYTCADPGVNPVNYCTTCLPVWLQARANAGHFPLVEPIVESPAPAPKKSKKTAQESDDEDSN